MAWARTAGGRLHALGWRRAVAETVPCEVLVRRREELCERPLMGSPAP